MLSSEKHPKVWVFVLLFYGTLLVMLSMSKSVGIYEAELKVLAKFMGGDKWMHLWMAMILAFLTTLVSISYFKAMPRGMTNLIVAAGLIVAICAEEMSQGLFSTRSVDVRDAMYGAAGVISGVAIYNFAVIARKLTIPSE